MSFSPMLFNAALPFLQSAGTAAIGAAGTYAANAFSPKPKIPAIPAMPKPVAPPNAPVNASHTAATERARIASQGHGSGTSGLVLTPLSGSAETSVKRTTLLGG